MKLKSKIARWLRKLAGWLDPRLEYNVPIVTQCINQSTYNIITIKSLQAYPLWLLEKRPDLDKVAKRDVARTMIENLAQSNCIQMTKNVKDGRIEYRGVLMVAEPKSI